MFLSYRYGSIWPIYPKQVSSRRKRPAGSALGVPGPSLCPKNLALHSRWSDSGFRRNDDAKFSLLMTFPLAFMQSPRQCPFSLIADRHCRPVADLRICRKRTFNLESASTSGRKAWWLKLLFQFDHPSCYAVVLMIVPTVGLWVFTTVGRRVCSVCWRLFGVGDCCPCSDAVIRV